ncbi:hypothetical protein ILYODFUR_010842 [Ilyodon furcidens]|uniref:Uncharacterized protein n=1 Tax=Ilyodon furcidens TaxID=33524 RepID=A0ABV0T9B2_9TELE
MTENARRPGGVLQASCNVQMVQYTANKWSNNKYNDIKRIQFIHLPLITIKHNSNNPNKERKKSCRQQYDDSGTNGYLQNCGSTIW